MHGPLNVKFLKEFFFAAIRSNKGQKPSHNEHTQKCVPSIVGVIQVEIICTIGTSSFYGEMNNLCKNLKINPQ